MAEQAIKNAGTDQCCCLCGDTKKIRDYIGDEQMTARLCEDCKRIQEQMHGAMFFPFSGD